MLLSFWLWGRKRKGRRNLFSVTVSFPLVLFAVVLVVAFGLQLIQLLRQIL